MIQLPESFVASVSRNMPGGRAWLKTLPETFSLCEYKWKLVDRVLCDGTRLPRLTPVSATPRP